MCLEALVRPLARYFSHPIRLLIHGTELHTVSLRKGTGNRRVAQKPRNQINKQPRVELEKESSLAKQTRIYLFRKPLFRPVANSIIVTGLPQSS